MSTATNDTQREAKRAYDRKRYREKRSEMLAKNKAYYQANREYFTAYERERYRRDPESARARMRSSRSNSPEVHLLMAARYRARKAGVPFDLNRDDIVIPDVCPVLGIKLQRGTGSWGTASPSLDRIVPAKGYVKGNVRVISWRANDIKKDAGPGELLALYEYVMDSLHP